MLEMAIASPRQGIGQANRFSVAFVSRQDGDGTDGRRWLVVVAGSMLPTVAPNACADPADRHHGLSVDVLRLRMTNLPFDTTSNS